MKKLLTALFVVVPVIGCSETIIKKSDATNPPATQPTQTPPETTEPPPEDTDAGPAQPLSNLPEDRCLDGQDMDGADVNISTCPELPSTPEPVAIGTDGKDEYELGAWEIGTTAEGATYKYGSLSAPGTNPRVLSYDGGKTDVNAQNIECWAKGYYRLRKMLQNPPAEYTLLRKKKFQYRFFQFQSDLRNGDTGFKQITSFQDHLVKWVSVINKQGVCQQPTLTMFRDYAKGELETRGIPLPEGG